MAEVKRCKQCGMLKDESNFRKYTYSKEAGTPGRYRICKNCEAINQAYRRAVNLCMTPDDAPTDKLAEAAATIKRIGKLYEVLEAKGFSTPISRSAAQEPVQPLYEEVDRLINFHEDLNTQFTTVSPNTEREGLPSDLSSWLTASFEEWRQSGISPEYLQETVYESLKAKYRPQIGFDQERYVPLYDDTYKAVLNNILRRFDDYEEATIEDVEPDSQVSF